MYEEAVMRAIAPAIRNEIGVAPFAPATMRPNVANNPPPIIPPTQFRRRQSTASRMHQSPSNGLVRHCRPRQLPATGRAPT
jgi:hypothetical protein